MARIENVTRAFLKAHPAEAAIVLGRIAPEHCAALLNELPVRFGGPVFRQLLPAHAARCLEHLDPGLAGAFLRLMPTQRGAAVLRHTRAETRARLLPLLPATAALSLRLLLGYPDDTVGAWVNAHVPALPPDTPVKDALAHVRRIGDEPGEYLYVVDLDRRLHGIVPLAHAMRSGARVPLAALIGRPAPTLPAAAAIAAAHAHPGWKDFHALPVIDADGRFIGTLPYRAVAEAVARRSGATLGGVVTETLSGMVGLYWAAISGLIKSVIPLALSASRRAGPRGTR